MRSIINEPRLKKRADRGRRIMTAGIVMLVFSVFLSLNRQTIVAAYVVMLAGLILVNIGSTVGGKLVRQTRPDQILDRALKGLDHGSRLYSYLLPAEHVLLSQAGLITITIRVQDGQISCNGDKWRRRLTPGLLLRALFEAPLGNPGRLARNDAAAVGRWVASHLPDRCAQVPVQPLIVFVHPKAVLQLRDPAVPAVTLSDLKAYLRQATENKAVDHPTLKSLTDLCDELAA